MKKTLATVLAASLLTASVFTVVIAASCASDRCKHTTCENGGSCDAGKCSCATGYEGDRCQTASSAKFIRTWGVTNETASIAEPATFTVTVTDGSGVTGVVIHNLHNYFSAVPAKISGTTITIPLQTIQGKTVEGEGTISSSSVYGVNNTISISYIVTDVTTFKTDQETETWQG